jgi:hypothetical protein
MLLQQYYELFLGQVKVCEEVGVTIADESLVESIAESNGRANVPEDTNWDAACEQALAIHFIRGVNENHKTYLTHLRNSFLDGSDYYPATLHEAYNILQHHEPEGGHMTVGDGQLELAFVNTGGGQL